MTSVEPSTSSASSNRTRLALVVALVLAAAVAGTVIFVAVRGDDSTTRLSARDTVSSRQLYAACQEWMDTPEASRGGTGSDWCGRMIGWMRDEVTSGRMTGAMMWGSAEVARERCVQAMDSSRAVDDPEALCRSMVGWMVAHRGDWDGWMMDPTMMGR